MRGHATLVSSAQQDWRTPKVLFDHVSALAGGFDLDAAADADNHLCQFWLGPGGIYTDALTAEWARYSPLKAWLNPPYGHALRQFSTKAVEQVTKHRNLEVWMLVPARVDTRWWNLLMTRAVEVYFLAGRVKFERPDGARDAAPFPSAIVQLRYDGGTPMVVWGWRP